MNTRDFDRKFQQRRDEFDRRWSKSERRFAIAMIVSAILGIAALGALCYVAYHFISKVW